jgi:hypothetical protein
LQFHLLSRNFDRLKLYSMKNSSCIKNGFLTLTLIFSFFNLFAQEGYFEQGYGNDKKECGYGIIIKDNFRVAMAGYQEVTLGGQKDFFLCMTDSLGDTLLTKRYGGSSNEEAYSLLHTSDNGYLLTGYTESYGAGSKDAYLVKTDSNGVVEWTRTIGSSDEEVAYSAIEVLGTGFMVTGYRKYSNGKTDILVAMVDQVGAISWNTNYGGNDSEAGYDLKEKSSSSFIVVGTDNSTTPSTSFILEINASGTQQSYMQLYTTKPLNIKALDFDRSQGYLVAGTVEQSNGKTDGYFAKVNVLGTIEQSREYGGGGNDGFNDIKRLGGAIALLGFTGSYGEGESDLWIAFTDSIGDTIRTITAGGIGDDVGYAMYHNRGRIYTTVYNDSYGIEETGNMYEARFEIFGIGTLASHGEQMPLFYSEAIDCSMKRVMYVSRMFYGKDRDHNEEICWWCDLEEEGYSQYNDDYGGDEYKLSSTELEDDNLNLGIIGNTSEEDKLIEFCKIHDIKEIIFYDSHHLFQQQYDESQPYDNPNFDYSVEVEISPGNYQFVEMEKYLKQRLNRFIKNAMTPDQDGFYLTNVGISVGGSRTTNSEFGLPKLMAEYNYYVQQQNYNYTSTGKISTVTLEDEFWRSTESYSVFLTEFDDHKIYLQRLLNLKPRDLNIQQANDYIGYLNKEKNPDDEENDHTNTQIKIRSQEIEDIIDNVSNSYRLDRIYKMYYTTCSNEEIRGTNDQPFQWDKFAYSTTVFGKRSGSRETQIFPLFSSEAKSIPAIGGDDADFLGYWWATRDPNAPAETRTMIDAERKFMNAYPNNTYISHADAGANKAFNGFCYFSYQFLQKVSAYNIDQSQSLNFSNNNATGRVQESEYSTLITNPCVRYIPVFVPKGKRGQLTNVKEQGETSRLLAYPNPSNGSFNIQLSGICEQQLYLKIIDIQGRECFTTTLKSNSDIPSIDLGHLPTGIYFMEVYSSTSLLTKSKIIIFD